LTDVAVARLSLDEPLGDLRVDHASTEVLAVVLSHGEVAGELVLSAAEGRVGVPELRRVLAAKLGERLWRQDLERAFVRATRAGEPDTPAPPSVCVAVSTSGHAEGPDACLDAVRALRTQPEETVTLDRDADRAVLESNSEVIAFIDDGALPDPAWLDGLATPFSDPLVMAVAGYVGLSEAGGDRERGEGSVRVFERTLYDGLVTTEADLRPGNLLVRRRALEQLGPYDADLVPRILRAGHRVVFEPGRIVWPRRRSAAPRPVEVRHAPPPATPARVARAANPEVTVTIASYNRRERLTAVLRGLAAQTYPAERFELVLVLDGSTDGSAEVARSLDLPYRMRVLEQENRGLAACRNRGGEEAEHPIVVWLDDDIVPDPGFLSAHAAAHADGHEGIVLGHYPPVDGSDDLLSTMVRGVWHDFFRRRSEPDHKWSYIDFADGNISANPRLMAEAGGWDEDFAQQTVRRQDWEFAIRLLGRGVRFEDCPEASGRHHFDSTLPTALRNRRVEGHSDVVLGQKHPSARGHLFLARLARTTVAGGRRARLLEALYRRPALATGLIRGGLPLLRPLESLDARTRWWPLFGQFLSLAYMTGVRDALPSLEEFRDFVAPVLSREYDERVPVALDQSGVLDTAPAVTPVTLSLAYGATAVGELDALEPEAQWDWGRLSQRVVAECWQSYRAAVVGCRPSTGDDVAMALPEAGGPA
jgi:glycosyltransferase involved in cell wall biosynthesis